MENKDTISDTINHIKAALALELWDIIGKDNSDAVRYKKDTFIMAILFNYNDDFHLVIMKDTEGIRVNRWENSPNVFYGEIKTFTELRNIMRYTGAIEY